MVLCLVSVLPVCFTPGPRMCSGNVGAAYTLRFAELGVVSVPRLVCVGH